LTFGFRLWFSSNNIIAGNNISDCDIASINLGHAHNNTFYHNNFAGKPRCHVMDEYTDQNIRDALPEMALSANFWDNGSEGNYWSDYNGADVDGNGIGDTPYTIKTVYYDLDLGKQATLDCGEDSYPLMNPLDATNTTLELLNPTSSPTPIPSSTVSVPLSPSPNTPLSPAVSSSPSVPEFPYG
jgi:parallel beta-helix repeat protein